MQRFTPIKTQADVLREALPLATGISFQNAIFRDKSELSFTGLFYINSSDEIKYSQKKYLSVFKKYGP